MRAGAGVRETHVAMRRTDAVSAVGHAMVPPRGQPSNADGVVACDGRTHAREAHRTRTADKATVSHNRSRATAASQGTPLAEAAPRRAAVANGEVGSRPGRTELGTRQEWGGAQLGSKWAVGRRRTSSHSKVLVSCSRRGATRRPARRTEGAPRRAGGGSHVSEGRGWAGSQCGCVCGEQERAARPKGITAVENRARWPAPWRRGRNASAHL